MRDRATTTALNYVLLLGIVSILISALVFGVGGLVNDQQERAVRSQLEVVGNRLANDITAVDGIATQTNAEVTMRSELPERSVGSRYTVSVGTLPNPSLYRLTLRSVDPDVVVRVRFRSQTTVTSTTVRGGQVAVQYDPSADEVSVRD